jgi:hypothetical protein
MDKNKLPWPNLLPKSARWREVTPELQSMSWSASCEAKDATAAARVSAANAVLDRGWGKATQPHEGGPDGAIALVHRIERVIVHPHKPVPTMSERESGDAED